jgi:hypothetical protein
MTYSNQQTEHLAWMSMAADPAMGERWSDKQMVDLNEALTGYKKHQPSPEKVTGWVQQYGHEECVPPQVWRDGMIVDFLLIQKDYSLQEAVSLWSDWEDFEYDILNTQTV